MLEDDGPEQLDAPEGSTIAATQGEGSKDLTSAETPEDESPDLADGAHKALSRIVESGREEVLLDTFDSVLRHKISPTTYTHLLDAARRVVDVRTMAFLIGLMQQSPEERLNEIEGLQWEERVVALVDTILARYGASMIHAWDIWPRTGRAHEWFVARWEIRHLVADAGTATLFVFEVTKRNREVVRLAGEPRSMLRLATRFIDGLANVDDPELFDAEDVEAFFEACEALRKASGGESPEAPESRPSNTTGST